MELILRMTLTPLLILACVHDQNQGHHEPHSHQEKGEKHPITQNVEIGEDLIAHRYGDIYFSSQPSNKDLAMLLDQGFAVIVNLRQAQEGPYNETSEKNHIAALGLKYEHIPMDPSLPISDEFIASVTAAVQKHRSSGKILIHCSSGNRVGMWLGGHFHKDHGFSKEESLELAKKLGLTNENAIQKVKEYLKFNEDAL